MTQSLLSPSAVEAGLIALAGVRATPAQQNAAAAFARAGLPHRRLEAFKWSDFRAALRDPIVRATPPDTFPSILPSRLPGFSGAKPFDLDAYVVEIANGVAEEAAFAPDGVTVQTRLNDEGLSIALGDHPLALLAAATATRRTDILVEGKIAEPLWIRRMALDGASASRVRIVLAPGATLTLVESYEARGRSFAADVTEFEIADSAHLQRFVFQDGDDQSVAAALAGARLGRTAQIEQTALVFGGALARVETRVTQSGDDSTVELRSASLLSEARHADVTTYVRHQALNGKTQQLHKSALRGRARGVFQGKFYVARGAQKTDATMQANALLLSADAEINHKPELEIYADDVQCAHGATSGALDVDALFYLRQRGLSGDAARALLVEAFLTEAFDGERNPNVVALFRTRAMAWLSAS